MKKILVISNVNELSAAYRYRILYPLERLSDVVEFQVINFYSEKTYTRLKDRSIKKIFYILYDLIKTFIRLLQLRHIKYDTILVKNYLWPLLGANVERLTLKLLKHKRVVYDIDDAIYLNTQTERNKYLRIFRNAKSKVLFWTSIADYNIFSNEIIRNDINILNPQIKTKMYTCVLSLVKQDEYFSKIEDIKQSKDTTKRLFVWLGSPHTESNLLHWKDFMSKILSDPLNELHFIGAKANLLGFDTFKNVFHHEWNKEIEIEILKKSHFGLNPLINNEFELRKSAFKVIQYYRSGIIPIVSDIGINKALINKYGGHVFEGTKEAIEYYESNFNINSNLSIFEKTKDLTLESVIPIYKSILTK